MNNSSLVTRYDGESKERIEVDSSVADVAEPVTLKIKTTLPLLSSLSKALSEAIMKEHKRSVSQSSEDPCLLFCMPPSIKYVCVLEAGFLVG